MADPIRIDSATSVVEDDAIPWVDLGPGVEMKLLRIGESDQTYTMINRFAPGFEAPKHLHLGDVHAYTIQGRWHYHEYDWYSTAGDYVYEPPDTIHTLHVPEDNTEPTIVLFIVNRGMDLYDGDGNVFMTQNGEGMTALYKAGLVNKGLPFPEAVLA